MRSLHAETTQDWLPRPAIRGFRTTEFSSPCWLRCGSSHPQQPASCFSDVSQSVIFLMNTYRVPRSVPGRGAAVGTADVLQTPRQAVPEERDGGSPGCQGQAEQNPRFTPGTREGGPSLHAFPNGRNSKLGCST